MVCVTWGDGDYNPQMFDLWWPSCLSRELEALEAAQIRVHREQLAQ